MEKVSPSSSAEGIINRVKLGVLLKSMREADGKSQRDSAVRIGYANATFVCNVEKGSNNIPINKLMDFAREYCPDERYKMAATILVCVLPEVWDSCVYIFPELLGSEKTGKELTKEILEWMDKKIDQYGVKF